MAAVYQYCSNEAKRRVGEIRLTTQQNSQFLYEIYRSNDHNDQLVGEVTPDGTIYKIQQDEKMKVGSIRFDIVYSYNQRGYFHAVGDVDLGRLYLYQPGGDKCEIGVVQDTTDSVASGAALLLLFVLCNDEGLGAKRSAFVSIES